MPGCSGVRPTRRPAADPRRPRRRVRARRCSRLRAATTTPEAARARPRPGRTRARVPAPSAPISLDDLAAASGDAPAASGGGIVEPPGPADRTGPARRRRDGGVDHRLRRRRSRPAACSWRRTRDAAAGPHGGHRPRRLPGDGVRVGRGHVRRLLDAEHADPLSIAFFAADGAYVGGYDMEPCDDSSDCPAYPSPGTYRFALEVVQGDLDDLGVGPGSRLALGGDCAGRGRRALTVTPRGHHGDVSNRRSRPLRFPGPYSPCSAPAGPRHGRVRREVCSPCEPMN